MSEIISTITNEYKSEYFIDTVYEYVDGFRYKQPVEYLNGKQYKEYADNSYEKLNWGTIFWDSYKYENLLRILNYKSVYWIDRESYNNTLKIIKDFLSNKRFGDVFPLLEFEVFLINTGFNLTCFAELNTYDPGFNYYKGNFYFTRVYFNGETHIAIAFGLFLNGKRHYIHYVVENGFYYLPDTSNFELFLKNEMRNQINIENIKGLFCTYKDIF